MILQKEHKEIQRERERVRKIKIDEIEVGEDSFFLGAGVRTAQITPQHFLIKQRVFLAKLQII